VGGICVGCGLCCDGTIHPHVALERDDPFELLASAGITFFVKDITKSFRQPCPAYGAGCCSIYQDRPSVCREYRCLLLRRHKAGEVSADEASALIARTTELRDRVRAGLSAYVDPEGSVALDGLYRLMLAKFDAEPHPAAARREHSDLLLTVAALRVILAREFEPRD
jgi:Fe-S-cluster containining protein